MDQKLQGPRIPTAEDAVLPSPTFYRLIGFMHVHSPLLTISASNWATMQLHASLELWLAETQTATARNRTRHKVSQTFSAVQRVRNWEGEFNLLIFFFSQSPSTMKRAMFIDMWLAETCLVGLTKSIFSDLVALHNYIVLSGWADHESKEMRLWTGQQEGFVCIRLYTSSFPRHQYILRLHQIHMPQLTVKPPLSKGGT